MGSRMYYNFYGSDLDDQHVFEGRIDAVLREIGERGRCSVSESVPPAAASTPAAVSAVPNSVGPAQAAQSFSPSVQMSAHASAPQQQQLTGGANGLVDLTALLREQLEAARSDRAEFRDALATQRKELESRLAEQKQEMEATVVAMKPTPPAEAISGPQLAELQARVEGLHQAKLLTDDELYTCEGEYCLMRELRVPRVHETLSD